MANRQLMRLDGLYQHPFLKRFGAVFVFAGRALGQQKHQHDAPANERQQIEELPIAGPAGVMQSACCHRDERDQQNQMRECQNAANPCLAA